MKPKFYNTLHRRVEEFSPIEPGHIRLYTCGPTVYDFAHIGNFRAYVFEDLLKRLLLFLGYKVTHVMNLTDVDDKTIRAANEQGTPLREYTRVYIDAFFEDLNALNIVPADEYPAATDHVEEMKAMIQTLIDKGYAYTTDSGDVYFSIEKYDKYGQLANLNLDEMRKGERVADDEYEKESLVDFALWKGHTERDGDVAWDAPWGRGRPGWHIECSAMATRYLGPHFDIHCGGVDNIFPHHEDEIAQSECCSGEKFVNYWLHNAHLIVDGKKMSKSEGNFYTLRMLQNKGWTGREIRYELIATRYRDQLNFTFAGLQERRGNLQRIDDFQERLAKLADGADRSDDPPLPAWALGAEQAFAEALCDDLNIAGALAVLFNLLNDGNRAMDNSEVTAAHAVAVQKVLARLDEVLGFIIAPDDEADVDPELLRLVEAREAARAEKNWVEADRIRDELAERGWKIDDTPDGSKLKRL